MLELTGAGVVAVGMEELVQSMARHLIGSRSDNTVYKYFGAFKFLSDPRSYWKPDSGIGVFETTEVNITSTRYYRQLQSRIQSEAETCAQHIHHTAATSADELSNYLRTFHTNFKMNFLLAVSVLSVLLASVNSACNIDTVLTCTTTYTDGIKGNSNDLSTVCRLTRTYLSCVRTSGCAENESVKSQLASAEQVVNDKCGACQVQVSILCLALMLVAMLFSK
ncbi:uncharacterized protein LOC121368744 [Gigantopelta aegis]|uniref:uncharacterized protein LOC121368744 n=1 Tax=Gigantopelta aegis TaxID=1735272 RepID=UPI001B889112|nr:uncharacterized protein LOC121368744 [Gigantopelta aegis]